MVWRFINQYIIIINTLHLKLKTRYLRYVHNRPSLVQIIACRVFGVKSGFGATWSYCPGTMFRGILIEIQTLSFNKLHWNITSVVWRQLISMSRTPWALSSVSWTSKEWQKLDFVKGNQDKNESAAEKSKKDPDHVSALTVYPANSISDNPTFGKLLIHIVYIFENLP